MSKKTQEELRALRIAKEKEKKEAEKAAAAVPPPPKIRESSD